MVLEAAITLCLAALDWSVTGSLNGAVVEQSAITWPITAPIKVLRVKGEPLGTVAGAVCHG